MKEGKGGEEAHCFNLASSEATTPGFCAETSALSYGSSSRSQRHGVSMVHGSEQSQVSTSEVTGTVVLFG